MSNQRKIQPVKDMKDKQYTYRTMLSRYNAAMKYGFYLEALLIDYALMEDRLRSFIYHIGGLKDHNAYKIHKLIGRYLLPIVRTYDPNGNLGISNISGKKRIVRALVKWEETPRDPAEDRYLRTLRSGLEELDIDGLLQTLNDIDEWCDYRNECIHAVMNKNIDSLDSEIEARAAQGMQYARFLDTQVTTIKSRNAIRRAAGL